MSEEQGIQRRTRWLSQAWIAVPLAVLAVGGCTSGDGAECSVDADCGEGVCARNGECTLPADVRPVTVNWTIRGEAASAQTCSRSPDLYIDFLGNSADDLWSYDPAPCPAGRFFVDKLPRRFDRVEIGNLDETWYELDGIGPDGTVTLNLMPL